VSSRPPVTDLSTSKRLGPAPLLSERRHGTGSGRTQPLVGWRYRMALVAGLLAAAGLALAANVVVAEDWTGYPVGSRGIPPGWERQHWGSPHNAFPVVEDGGLKALHLKSTGRQLDHQQADQGDSQSEGDTDSRVDWKVVVSLPAR
jgi:hypothetical protein